MSKLEMPTYKFSDLKPTDTFRCPGREVLRVRNDRESVDKTHIYKSSSFKLPGQPNPRVRSRNKNQGKRSKIVKTYSGTNTFLEGAQIQIALFEAKNPIRLYESTGILEGDR